ncbi:MAG TPA: thymidine phosphorylase [Actinomycetaceae bacterium]|nr:thymidine phosphorylase [Actinomycetaceae bacterium]
MEAFDAVDVIRAKRDGHALRAEQIHWFLDAYMRGVVADEQAAALAMAIYLNGMAGVELSEWTQAMIASGERMDLSGLGRPAVDKHSTGGVGDNITLPLVPLVAACGAAVPQISGRGLGHTGGTLDKMEAIPGWRAELSAAHIRRQLGNVGAVICGASPTLAPADRRLYALRDTTATVESLPLIASSIMSKKIAGGTDALVLDVKVGSGAFMKDLPAAEALAATMVELGAEAGLPTTAVLTDMATPLGYAVGNGLEVAEAIDVLAGGGPSDVVELTLALAREMLTAVGHSHSDPAAALADGSAMDVWRAMIRAQGGDPTAPLPQAREHDTLHAPRDGVVRRLDAYPVGLAAWRAGAGRARQGDDVQAEAGVQLHCRQGESVRAGQPLATIYSQTPQRLPRALATLADAFDIGEAVPHKVGPLLVERYPPKPPPLDGAGWFDLARHRRKGHTENTPDDVQ